MVLPNTTLVQIVLKKLKLNLDKIGKLWYNNYSESEVIKMTKWVIAYKGEDDKWHIYAKVGSRARIAEKLDKLFEFNNKITKIQIQKIVE